MGAWGEGPYDNDSACDWLGAAADAMERIIKSGLSSRWPEERIAAANLLLELPDKLRGARTEYVAAESLEAVEQAVQEAPGEGWRNGPEARLRTLTVLHTALKRLYAITRRQEAKKRKCLAHLFKRPKTVRKVRSR
jgi:hypothetical protein